MGQAGTGDRATARAAGRTSARRVAPGASGGVSGGVLGGVLGGVSSGVSSGAVGGARSVRATVGAVALALPLVLLPLPGTGVAVAHPVPASAPAAVTPVDEQGDVTYYVVQEAWEGQPEFLYSIAERLLGTGDRALEIYELNEGRAQPGGMTVSDPNVIRPGWVLLLPPDAAGDGVVVGPLPTPPPRAVRATPTATPSARAAATGDDRADAAGGDRDSADDRGSADDRDGGGASGDGVSGGASGDDASSGTASLVTTGLTVLAAATGGIAALVLLVGGAVVLVRRRRAARPDPAPAPVVRREDPGAWTVDRTTRALAQACAAAGRAVPAAHCLVLSDDHVRLRLSTPDAHPPAGWSATDEGRTWRSPMRPLQDVALDPHVGAPFPRLVTLGDDADGRVLVDLAQAGPGVGLDGDLTQSTALAEHWLHELARSPWSQHVPVVAVGVGGSSFERLDEAGPAVDAAGGGVLVVAGARTRDAGMLASLAEDPAWTVVVVGPAGRDWARWRLTLDADGVATGGPFDGEVHVVGGRRLEPA